MSVLSQFSDLELDAIHCAFCGYSGADRRWAELAKHGATDAQLRTFAAQEMGLGGSGGPAPTVRVATHNNPPRIWLYEFYCGTKTKPTLDGHALLAAARELFNIDYPPPVEGQLSLLALLTTS